MQSLRGWSPGSLDDKNANLEADSVGTVQKVSEVSKDSIGNWATVYSRQNLTKSLAAFCLYAGNLGKAEIKSSDFFGRGNQETGQNSGYSRTATLYPGVR